MLKNKSTSVIVRRIKENYPLAVVEFTFPCPVADCPIVVKGNALVLLAHISKHGYKLGEVIDLARQVIAPRLEAINQKREENKNRFFGSKTDFLKRKR